MRTIDLTTRREGREPASIAAADGQVFELPPFLPVKAMKASMGLASAGSDPKGALAAVDELYAALFGAEADHAMEKIGLNELQDVITEVYLVTASELPASAAS
jgi:hypothetical protein